MPVYTIFYIFVIVVLIINFKYYRKCEKPLMSAFFGGLSGIIFLLIVSNILKLLGYKLLINYTTIVISLILGIPGVILMGTLLFL